MSDSMTVNVTCPKCKTAGEAEIWTRVNNAESPDEAQWLIDGFLFQYECPECGNIADLNHDCLYEDATRKALVMYVADPARADGVLADLEEDKPAGYYVRIVDSRDSLREKAALLRDGLDDRAVEVAKRALANRLVSTGEVSRDARVLYGALDEDGGIIVEFVAPTGSSETTIPAHVYQGIADSFTDVQPSVVDADWATGVLKQWE